MHRIVRSGQHSACVEPLEQRQMLALVGSLVKDINPGNASGGSSSESSIIAYKDKLLFRATSPGTGEELWISDGTSAGTKLVKDINPNGGSQISEFRVLGNYVVFSANDGTKLDLWRTDGTTAGTVKITNLPASPVFLQTLGSKVLFTILGGGLWSADVNGNQAEISAGTPVIKWLGVVNNKALFETSIASDDFLYSTDGSSAALVMDPEPATTTSFFTPGVTLNGYLYFGMSAPNIGEELHRTDGTAQGTQLLKNIDTDQFDGSSPQRFTVVGSFVYFTADDEDDEQQLWRTDGATVTQLTFDNDTFASNLANANGTLYFSYNKLLYKIAPGGSPTTVGGDVGGTSPSQTIAVGSRVYFTALGELGTSVMFTSDGSSRDPIGGDLAQAGDSPFYLTAVGNKIFYIATDPTNGYELRVITDDTPPPPVISVALRANGKSSATVNEGATVQFNTVVTGVARDQVKKYYYFFEDPAPDPSVQSIQAAGASGQVAAGPKPTHTYLDDPVGALDVYNVRCKFVFKDGSAKNAYVKVTVKNVAPQFNVGFTQGDGLGEPIQLIGEWAVWNPLKIQVPIQEANEEDATVVSIKWGDGSPVEVYPVESQSVTANHVYKAIGDYTLEVIAHDKDGAKRKKNPTMKIDQWTFRTDIRDNVVYRVGGTSASDILEVIPVPDELYSRVLLNGVELFNTDGGDTHFDSSSQLIAHMGPGNDSVEYTSKSLDSIIVGDSGSDTLNDKPIK